MIHHRGTILCFMSTRFALIVNFGYFGAIRFLHNDIGNSWNQIWVQTIINWGKIILHIDILDVFTGIVFPLMMASASSVAAALAHLHFNERASNSLMSELVGGGSPNISSRRSTNGCVLVPIRARCILVHPSYPHLAPSLCSFWEIWIL